MGKDSKSRAAQETLTTESIFGPAPILPGENASAYEALLRRVSAAVKPIDIIEESWVHDIVNHTWEILRWRRLKANLVVAAMPVALEEFIRPFMPDSEEPVPPHLKDADALTTALWREETREMTEESIARAWVAKEESAVNLVNALVAGGKFSMDEVTTSAFIRELGNIERIDRLELVAESRRNAVLREIERHRTGFAQSLRGEIQEVEDAEFEIIKPRSIPRRVQSKKNAA